MSQEDLAAKLGVTFQAVSKWETGTTCPDIELLPLISNVFHISVDFLLQGEAITDKNYYDHKYRQEEYYWGLQPSLLCYRVLEHMPPVKRLRLLDIGCGEGKDAVFFARNGYEVTAFDLASSGIEKTKRLADALGVYVHAFVADVNEFRPETTFDIIYSNGVLHYIPPALREEIFTCYKNHTAENGIHALSAFVKKPFIPRAPENEPNAFPWLSGQLFTLYHDWEIRLGEEVIFDCMSSGTPHRHAMNRMIAQKQGVSS